MSDFHDYVRQNALVEYFKWHPYNEVINLMYSTLGWLVRDQCEALIITRTRVQYRKAGRLYKHFDIARHEEECAKAKQGGNYDHAYCLSYRDAMKLIYEHDARVRQHFRLVEETPDAVKYDILPDPLAEE